MKLDTFNEEFLKIKTRYKALERSTDEYLRLLTERPVVIFGASFVGDIFYAKLATMGATIRGFCDNYRSGTTPNGHGPIFTAEDLLKNHTDANVVISVNARRQEAARQLLELGLDEARLFNNNNALWAQGGLKEFERHLDGYAWAYEFFGDETSKRIVLGRINRYLFGDPLRSSTDDAEYFKKDVIKLGANEVFVDGGCYIGDTIEEFFRQSGGAFRHIYAFEPDAANWKHAMAAYADNVSITCLNEGLWCEDTSLQFHSVHNSGAGSFSPGQVLSESVVSIHATSIDAFFEKKLEQPTFIKLDVEGAEALALRGGEKTIRSFHPKLAICVYHKPEDVFEIPRLIAEYDASYRMALAQHGDNIHETILYGI